MPALKDKFSRPTKAVPQPEALRKLSFGTIAQKREDTRTACRPERSLARPLPLEILYRQDPALSIT